MSQKLIQRLTLGIACVALFAAVGGPSYAVNATTSALKKNTVTNKSIKSNAVTSGKIKNGEVKTADLANGAVTNPKIAASAVDGGKIADGAVGGTKLGANSVDGSKIADGAVGNADIANDAITSAKIANGSLTGKDVGIDSGSLTWNPPSVAANTCTFSVVDVPGTPDLRGAAIAMTLDDNVSGDDVSWSTLNSPSAGFIRVQLCNPSIAAVDLPSTTLRWVAFTP